jgi:hypothetical protein
MTRNWKCFGSSAVLAVAFATTAIADPEPKNDTVQLLRALQASSDKMQSQLDDLTKGNLQTQKALEDVTAMRHELDQLKTQVAQLQKKVDELGRTGPRISGYGPTPPSTGRIVLQNDYPGAVSVVVGNSIYQLAQGARYAVEDQPAGSFTYQVFVPGSSFSAQTRQIAANETLQIRVVPR